LENEMRRVVALSTRKVVTEEDLSDKIRNDNGGALALPITANGAFKDTVAVLEKRLIAEALQARRNNQQQTAKLLGLSRQGLIKKMKRYGMKGI
jgi:DNA-binding NtrC family response regulator